MKIGHKFALVAIGFALILALCGCDASLERSVCGSWQSGEGYIFTFDEQFLTVTASNGDELLGNIEYRAQNGIMTFVVNGESIDMFYYTIYADTLRLEYTEPVLEYLGEEVQEQFTDRLLVLERY